MRDPRTRDGVGGQPDGVEIARFLQPLLDRGHGIGGVGAEAAYGISGDHRIERILPTVGAVDIAIAQGAALQHAELVKQEVRVVAGAIATSVPCGAFLIVVGGADRSVHIQQDILKPLPIVKAVNPLAIQIGQRLPVLGQGQRLGFEPPICEAETCPALARCWPRCGGTGGC